MKRSDIPFEHFAPRAVNLWGKDSLLLAAGDLAAGDWNCMTVGWGAFGRMWNRPTALVVVRPTRYTRGFMDRYDAFTLTAYPEALHPVLEYCGSHSGRDGDKAKAAGLTPVAARTVKAPAFAEADLVVECRKIYFDDFEPRQFLADWIEACYPKKDYHRMYFGEILAIAGTAKYRAKDKI